MVLFLWAGVWAAALESCAIADSVAQSETCTNSALEPVQAGPTISGDVLMTAQSPDSISLTWPAADNSAAPIHHYQIYRNGARLAVAKRAKYTDSSASEASEPSFDRPASIYAYSVAAVDTNCREGPRTTRLVYWAYHDGHYAWSGDYSNVTLNYRDTAGMPAGGRYDIAVSATTPNGYAQPFSGPPSVREYSLEIGAFKYMILDLKPTIANQVWRLNIISRLPQGDVFNNAPVILPGKYGPQPIVGKWATYKIPLNPDLAVGTGALVGSIAGDVLTVASVEPGMSVQTTSWLTGPGVAPKTYILQFLSGNGGPGTYAVRPAQTVANERMKMQRTNMYKFSLTDFTTQVNNVYYIDNIGFTTQ